MKKKQLTTVRPMYFDVGGNKVDCELARISLITIRPIHTHTHTPFGQFTNIDNVGISKLR